MQTLTSIMHLLSLCLIYQQVNADEIQSQGLRTVTRIYDEVDIFINYL